MIFERGYVVEFVDDDPDYHRWTVVVSDPNAAVLTPELVAHRWRQIVPVVEAHKGAMGGWGMGVEIGYGDAAKQPPE